MSRRSRGLRTESPDPLPRLEKAPCHPLRLSGCLALLGSAWISAGSSAAPPATQPTVFMAASGSDSGRCSRARPCRTFDRAYQVAAPGATIQVGAGPTRGRRSILDPHKRSAGRRRLSAGARSQSRRQGGARRARSPPGVAWHDDRAGQLPALRRRRHAPQHRQARHVMKAPPTSRSSAARSAAAICDYHPQMQNERQPTSPPPTSSSTASLPRLAVGDVGQHTECLQILRRRRDHDPQLDLPPVRHRQPAPGPPPRSHISWLRHRPCHRNVLLENNFIYASGNSFTIQASDFDNLDLSTTRSPARSSSSTAKAAAPAWTSSATTWATRRRLHRRKQRRPDQLALQRHQRRHLRPHRQERRQRLHRPQQQPPPRTRLRCRQRAAILSDPRHRHRRSTPPDRQPPRRRRRRSCGSTDPRCVVPSSARARTGAQASPGSARPAAEPDTRRDRRRATVRRASTPAVCSLLRVLRTMPRHRQRQ